MKLFIDPVEMQAQFETSLAWPGLDGRIRGWS